MSLVLGIIALVLAIISAIMKRADMWHVMGMVAVACLAILHVAAGIGPY